MDGIRHLTGSDEEVAAIQTFWKWVVVVILVVAIHQLSSVVSLVAGFLHPWCKPLVVEPFTDEFLVTT